MGEIVLLRHGETAWSAAGRHTSYTDLPLTDMGERQATELAPLWVGHRWAAVWCSPRERARRTAELAQLPVDRVDSDLSEWNYGEYEGLTTAHIRSERPGWDLWRDGCPGGEAPATVGARSDRVLAAVEPQLAGGDVALVAHAHLLRVLAARWLGLGPQDGALLRLDVASVSVFGVERERRVLARWNAPGPALAAGVNGLGLAPRA